MDHQVRTVAHVSREFGSLIGHGGIKDFTKGITTACAAAGYNTHVFLTYPKNASVLAPLEPQGEPVTFAVQMDPSSTYRQREHVTLHTFGLPGHPNLLLHLLSADRFAYYSNGDVRIPRHGVYTLTQEEAAALGQPDRAGKAYPDAFETDVLLVKATLHALNHMRVIPDIIHCHDGHVGFLPLIAQFSRDPLAPALRHVPTLTTIHDATNRFRGEVKYDDHVASLCGVPDHLISKCLHMGKFDPVLIAALFGQGLSTVSENYAHEWQETSVDWLSDWLGHTLLGYGVRVVGITNGIDVNEFDPSDATRTGIAASFAPRCGDFVGKQRCKQALLQEVGFEGDSDETVVLTFVGRMAYNKGYDVLAEAVERLFAQDPDVVLIGNGSGYWRTVQIVRHLREHYPKRVFVDFSYNLPFGHRILAGGDFCLMPSHYESCGTVDFIAQLFGTVPIVHAVGGLVKVIDGETGFSYRGGEHELYEKLREALDVYRHDTLRLRQIQQRAVAMIYEHFTWQQVFTQKYIPLYDDVIDRARPRRPL